MIAFVLLRYTADHFSVTGWGILVGLLFWLLVFVLIAGRK